MNLDNFIVRPRRDIVERYQQRERWEQLDALAMGELNNHIGPLPTEAEPINPGETSDEMAMRFDHLALRLQVALLEEGVIPEGLRLQVVELAHQLEAKASIPNVKQQLHFIQQVQSDEWWQDVTIPMLEELRRNLRLLIQFIDKAKREVVYTGFEDEEGEMERKDVVRIMGGGSGLTQYRKKVEAYIRSHEDHLTIQRIKRNRPVTAKDLVQLEEMLFQASGMEKREEYDETIHPEKSLGVFIRECVGLDRAAAKAAFSEFLNDTTMSSPQIQFINTLIDYFTQNGVMQPQHLPNRLSPTFTAIAYLAYFLMPKYTPSPRRFTGSTNMPRR
jgi:type I restriction enzyme R subunit